MRVNFYSLRLVDSAHYLRPRSPMAETEDLKSFQCRFESDRGHQSYLLSFIRA